MPTSSSNSSLHTVTDTHMTMTPESMTSKGITAALETRLQDRRLLWQTIAAALDATKRETIETGRWGSPRLLECATLDSFHVQWLVSVVCFRVRVCVCARARVCACVCARACVYVRVYFFLLAISHADFWLNISLSRGLHRCEQIPR